MIVLDERLAAVAQIVRPGSRIADVGTDHGYLITRLLMDGKAVFGYACDIHPNPWKRRPRRSRGMASRNDPPCCWEMGYRAFWRSR